MKPIYCLLVTVMVLFSAQRVDAIEVLSEEELWSHCMVLPDASDSVDGQYCIRYIQGFIDGAVTTDLRVMMNIEAATENSTESSPTFAERAIRTRLPSREDSERAAKYAEFCLGDPVPLVDVVENVVADLKADIEAERSLSARDAVYASLRKHYPCQED